MNIQKYFSTLDETRGVLVTPVAFQSTPLLQTLKKSRLRGLPSLDAKKKLLFHEFFLKVYIIAIDISKYIFLNYFFYVFYKKIKGFKFSMLMAIAHIIRFSIHQKIVRYAL